MKIQITVEDTNPKKGEIDVSVTIIDQTGDAKTSPAAHTVTKMLQMFDGKVTIHQVMDMRPRTQTEKNRDKRRKK